MNKCFSFMLMLASMLLLPWWSSSIVANDFVDVINSHAYNAGQQVIYEMNVGSYTAEGTFRAAESKLTELKRTGVDIIWLMPIYPRGGGINSPYAATDFKAVNPSYGTVNDLKSFVAAAHNQGMKVWLDWVPNHTATNATWVTTHPEYYKTIDGKMVHPNGYGDVYQLNYGNSDLVKAMNDCLKYWIDAADIDGYRCDYVSSSEIPTSYWQNCISMLKNYKSGKEVVILGEADFTDRNNIRLQSCGFDYDYAWSFHGKLEDYGAVGAYSSPLKVYCNDLINASKVMNVSRMLYITNHDQNWNYDKKSLSSKYGDNRYFLTVLSYTIWGMPMIYNGQEIGGEQALNYFTDTKIDWRSKDNKMYNTIRTLGALKHSQKALYDSSNYADNAAVNFINSNNTTTNILAYSRKAGDSEVIVIINTGNSAQYVNFSGINGSYSLWLNSETISKGVSRKSYTFNGTLSTTVPAKGYLIYVRGSFSDEELPTEQPLGDLVDSDAYSVFYESSVDNATVCAWMWTDAYGGEKYSTTGNWPGDAFTRIGITVEGKVVYKYSFTINDDLPLPEYIIITENGSADEHKVVNAAPFVNHGYYVKGSNEAQKTIPTGISHIYNKVADSSNKFYNISGKMVNNNYKGIVIHNGKKYMQ